jgi:hypothetical protein
MVFVTTENGDFKQFIWVFDQPKSVEICENMGNIYQENVPEHVGISNDVNIC